MKVTWNHRRLISVDSRGAQLHTATMAPLCQTLALAGLQPHTPPLAQKSGVGGHVPPLPLPRASLMVELHHAKWVTSKIFFNRIAFFLIQTMKMCCYLQLFFFSSFFPMKTFIRKCWNLACIIWKKILFPVPVFFKTNHFLSHYFNIFIPKLICLIQNNIRFPVFVFVYGYSCTQIPFHSCVNA